MFFSLLFAVSCSSNPELAERIKTQAISLKDPIFVIGPRQIVIVATSFYPYYELANGLCYASEGRSHFMEEGMAKIFYCTGKKAFSMAVWPLKELRYLILFTLPESLSFWYTTFPEKKSLAGYEDRLLSLALNNSQCKDVPEFSITMLGRYLEGEVDPEDFAQLCKEYTEWKRWKIRRHWRWK